MINYAKFLNRIPSILCRVKIMFSKKSALIMLALFAALVLSGCVNQEREQKNPLSVSNMEIVPGLIKTSTIELKVTTYVKNSEEKAKAGSSKNTTLLLKAISLDRDFLVNQSTAFLGKIEPGKTINVTQILTLPKKGGYRLQATLLEEEVEVGSGYRKVSNLESLPPDSKQIDLRIDGIDFLVRKVENGKAVIQSDIYITNFGARASQDFKLMLKATDVDSMLVADKQWSNTGLIGPDETAVRSVNLTVPDRYNYVVDVLLWSNSTIVGQGRDYVLLNATTMLSEKQRLATRGTRTGIFASERDESIEETPAPAEEMSVSEFESDAAKETAGAEAPGFLAMAAVLIIGLAAIFLKRKG